MARKHELSDAGEAIRKNLAKARREGNAALRLAKTVPWERDPDYPENVELLSYSVGQVREVLDALSDALRQPPDVEKPSV